MSNPEMNEQILILADWLDGRKHGRQGARFDFGWIRYKKVKYNLRRVCSVPPVSLLSPPLLEFKC